MALGSAAAVRRRNSRRRSWRELWRGWKAARECIIYEVEGGGGEEDGISLPEGAAAGERAQTSEAAE